LTRQQQEAPRWQQCVAATEERLGDLAVRAYLDDPAKTMTAQDAAGIVEEIQRTTAVRVGQALWLDDETRRHAVEKINAIAVSFGVSATGNEEASVALAPDAYFSNVLVARQRRFDRLTGQGQPGRSLERTPWLGSPFAANAFYRASFNDIVVPLGIVQPPLFDRRFPPPMNFGALGTVIGHELSHALDDYGRRFGTDGRPVDWWQPTSQRAFAERADCLHKVFGQYEARGAETMRFGTLSLKLAAIPLAVDRTANENLADVTGLRVAYEAYKQYASTHGQALPAVDTLTNDQLFFVSYAQMWCTNMNPWHARMLALTDTHAPERVRVNAALSQVPAFGEAFGCRVGDPMRPERVCELW
jgi:predicted metalloendopeptidase